MLSCALFTSYNSTSIGVLMDENFVKHQDLMPIFANLTAQHAVIAAALGLAAKRHGDQTKEILDGIEAELVSSSIWQLGNSNAPAELGEQYRKELSSIFKMARNLYQIR